MPETEKNEADVMSENKPEENEAVTEEEKANEEAEKAETAEENNGASEEEKPAEEVKPDDISGEYNGKNTNGENNPYFTPIRYINDGTIAIDDQIETLRQNYSKKLGKSRIINIISVVMMVLAFVAVILVTVLKTDETPSWVIWVTLGIALVIIIAAFALTTVFNKKNAKIAKEYLGEYEDTLNGFVLTDLNVVDPMLCVDAKVDDQEIIQAHYFHTIERIESRAVVEGKRNDYNFSVSEVAVVIPPTKVTDANKKPEDLVNLDGTTYEEPDIPNTMTGTQEVQSKDMTMVDISLSDEVMNDKEAKKRAKDQKKAKENQVTEVSSGLFGKFYSYDKAVDSQESVIICFMGSQEYTVLPSYTTGFKAVKVPGLRSNIVVYCADPRMAAPFFDEKGVELLNAITPNFAVQSLFISLNSYGSKVGIMLSDDIMQLPLKKLNHLGAYDLYKQATDEAFAFVDYATAKSILYR